MNKITEFLFINQRLTHLSYNHILYSQRWVLRNEREPGYFHLQFILGDFLLYLYFKQLHFCSVKNQWI